MVFTTYKVTNCFIATIYVTERLIHFQMEILLFFFFLNPFSSHLLRECLSSLLEFTLYLNYLIPTLTVWTWHNYNWSFAMSCEKDTTWNHNTKENIVYLYLTQACCLSQPGNHKKVLRCLALARASSHFIWTLFFGGAGAQKEVEQYAIDKHPLKNATRLRSWSTWVTVDEAFTCLKLCRYIAPCVRYSLNSSARAFRQFPCTFAFILISLISSILPQRPTKVLRQRKIKFRKSDSWIRY